MQRPLVTVMDCNHVPLNATIDCNDLWADGCKQGSFRISWHLEFHLQYPCKVSHRSSTVQACKWHPSTSSHLACVRAYRWLVAQLVSRYDTSTAQLAYGHIMNLFAQLMARLYHLGAPDDVEIPLAPADRTIRTTASGPRDASFCDGAPAWRSN